MASQFVNGSLCLLKEYLSYDNYSNTLVIVHFPDLDRSKPSDNSRGKSYRRDRDYVMRLPYLVAYWLILLSHL